MPASARYVVGIDLGTTNCVVAAAPLTGEDGPSAPVAVMPLPQLTAPGIVEARSQLPSFLYRPAEGELAPESLRLPWPSDGSDIVGAFAQRRGAEVPARLVSSAKSWLCASGVDRTAPILPWGSGEDVAKLSPVEATTAYLSHLRSAWNAAHPEAPLEEQEVLLTVPASFDAVARELTQRAAAAAGLGELTLLEEPQAAVYAWIDALGEAWRETVQAGDVLLVCDIGGGTTDFTLIAVRDAGGQLELERIAVGEHILLGGDNMDLALAWGVRPSLETSGPALDAWQFRALTLACREAKERLLTDATVAAHPVSILGRGSRLIGGVRRADVEREVVDRVLLDGFFPSCPADARPERQRRGALQELGLPYATDAAVTRHLAAFLRQQAGQGSDAPRPTAILFNGGVMRADRLRQRLLEVVDSWSPDRPGLRTLVGGDPDHAVARGAAYYGLARRGRGIRIRGGIARSYYLGIESSLPAVPGVRPPLKALCIVPQGLEEGSEVELPRHEFGLVTGEPTEFRLLTSTSRREDRVGDLLETWDDEIRELAPLETTLDGDGDLVPVRLEARVTELGVLEIWCVHRDGERRWRLEFQVRSTGTEGNP